MTWVQEEAVACFPLWVFWIIFQELCEEYIDEVCTSHGSAWVSAFGFLYCSCGEDADVIGEIIAGDDGVVLC